MYAFKYRPNAILIARFPSACGRCQGNIAVGERICRPELHYVHVTCPPRQEPTTAHIGTFTVGLAGGERRTVRVSRGEDVTFVSLLTGPDNDHDYACVGFIREGAFRWTKKHASPDRSPGMSTAVAAVLAADDGDLRAMGVAYALESGNCFVCGRTLTTPESIAQGIGPVCAGNW